MEDQNLQARKEEHSRLHDRVWSSSYKSRHRQITCDIFTQEKHMTRYH